MAGVSSVGGSDNGGEKRPESGEGRAIESILKRQEQQQEMMKKSQEQKSGGGGCK